MSNCEKSTVENVTAVDLPMNPNPIKRWLHKCDIQQVARLEVEICRSIERTTVDATEASVKKAFAAIQNGTVECYTVLTDEEDPGMPVAFVFCRRMNGEFCILGLDRFGVDPILIDGWKPLVQELDEIAGCKKRCKTANPMIMQLLLDCGYTPVSAEFTKEA